MMGVLITQKPSSPANRVPLLGLMGGVRDERDHQSLPSLRSCQPRHILRMYTYPFSTSAGIPKCRSHLNLMRH